jgi:hypothetical protein
MGGLWTTAAGLKGVLVASSGGKLLLLLKVSGGLGMVVGAVVG